MDSLSPNSEGHNGVNMLHLFIVYVVCKLHSNNTHCFQEFQDCSKHVGILSVDIAEISAR